MKYKNYFTALFPSLIDREGYYEIQKEMNFKSVENTMFNRFAGKGSFLAVVLPEDIERTSDIPFNSEKSLRVRPLDIHDFIIPEPCSSNDPEQVKKIIAMHPVAYPDNTVPKGSDQEKADSGLAVGQIVECYFVEAGPDDAGSLRGLRYRLKKESTASLVNLACIGGAAAGASTAFGSGKYSANNDYGSPQTGTYRGLAGQQKVTNGQLPDSLLKKTSVGIKLLIDAAADFNKLAAAFKKNFGEELKCTGGYRPYNIQVKAYVDPKKINKDGSHLAARPGTSEHGWGVSFDASTNLVGYNPPKGFMSNAKYKWLFNNAPKYNWYHPLWAQEPDGWPKVKKAPRGQKGSKPESWHWEWSKTDTVLRKSQ